MKVSVVLGGSVVAMLLAGCQSAPINNHSERASQAPVQSSRSSEAIIEPAVPYRVMPEPKGSVPVEPGPALILQELQSQAEIHLRDQRWESSIALAEQGLRIDRRQSAFYLILSESYLALGDLTQAQRFADQASRLCAKTCAEADRMQRRLASGN